MAPEVVPARVLSATDVAGELAWPGGFGVLRLLLLRQSRWTVVQSDMVMQGVLASEAFATQCAREISPSLAVYRLV